MSAMAISDFVTAPVKKEFQLSEQQQAFIAYCLDSTKGNVNLVARAGCGKTSTLLALVKALLANNARTTIYLGAYNAAIAKEIKTKLSGMGIEDWKQVDGRWIAPKATSGTLHSAGYNAWKKFAPDCARKEAIDDAKLFKIMDKLAADTPDRALDIEQLRAFANKTVSLAKQRAFGVLCAIEDKGKWFDMIDHFGLEEDLSDGYDLDKAVKFCIWLYRRSLEACKTTIDFDDMILAPLYFNVRMFQFDFVMIDEGQDTNPARRALAKKMLKPRFGRLVVVGDPAQAIYGFTGADSDSMYIIQREMGSAELPLNITYRCPKAVVALANTWVPDIKAADSAPEGIVRNVPLVPKFDATGAPVEKGFWDETLTAQDIILCRNTKPLVEMAYQLLRRGVACQVEGRAIAEGLVKIIRKWKVVKLSALDTAVTKYRESEVSKWLAKGKEQKADNVNDQCETILTLSAKLQEDGKNTVNELIDFVNSMFGSFDADPAVKPAILTLCTVHRSKGREWKRVYLLGRNAYMPSGYAKKDWQIEQEANLCYVAVTRAQEELVEVVVPIVQKRKG